MKQYRQGDVLLVEISEQEFRTREMTVRTDGIVALGEATGHSHALDSECATVFMEKNESGLAVNELGVLVHVRAERAILHHDEHAPIAIPKGYYRRIIQREYTVEHHSRFSRFVMD